MSSSIEPLLHCPRWGPCMMLAGRDEAPSGSEWATSSISNTDGPPRLVLLFESKLGPSRWLESPLFEKDSPFIDPSPFSESDVPASGPCVELELSLRKRPMIDFGCFGFSIPPNGAMMIGVFYNEGWRGEKRKKNKSENVGKKFHSKS